MKGNFRFQLIVNAGFVFLLTLFPTDEIVAQKADDVNLAIDKTPVSLIAENASLQGRVYILPGQTIRYKVVSSSNFEKGLITSITDSTISFQSKKFHDVTIRFNELAAFKIARSTERQVGGAMMTAFGSFIMIEGIEIMAEDGITADNPIASIFEVLSYAVFEFIGYASIRVGIVLMKPRQIDVQKGWDFHPTHAIVPGNVIRVILKNGEVVNRMNVRSITADKIIGVQHEIDLEGNHVRRRAVIVIDNILECSRIAQ